MAYATNYFTGDGKTTRWNVSFAGARPDARSGTTSYFKNADIKAALIIGAENGATQETPIQVSVVGASQVDIVPAVAEGQRFKVYRQSEREYPLVDFQEYSALTAADLDEAFRQTLYGVQELADLSEYSNSLANGARVLAQSSVANASSALGLSQDAQIRAQTAQVVASNSNNIAKNAASRVDGAVNTANSAKATAEGIAGTANDAKEIAKAARDTANYANSTAQGIAGTADNALATSKRAESVVASANTTANTAKNIAESIDGKVQQSISTATIAQSIATEARSIAQGIDGKASSAQYVAQNAKEIAQIASNTAGNSNNTANSAQQTASQTLAIVNNLGSMAKQNSDDVSLTGGTAELQNLGVRSGVELYGNTGFIDWHHDGDRNVDYTSRLWEPVRGELHVEGNLVVAGKLYASNLSDGAYMWRTTDSVWRLSGNVSEIATTKQLTEHRDSCTNYAGFGSYMLCGNVGSSSNINPGQVVPGSWLAPAAASGDWVSNLSGTWRCMGFCGGTSAAQTARVTLYVRLG